MARFRIAALVLTTLAAGPAFAQTDTLPHSTAVPPKTVKADPVDLSFREVPEGYELIYSNVPRQVVMGRVLTLAGVSVEWRDQDAGIQIVSGNHRGSLDTILSEMLAGRNFVATYSPVNAIPRMSHLTVLGPSGAGAQQVAVGVGSAPAADAPVQPAPEPAKAADACRPGAGPAPAVNSEPFISAAVSATGEGKMLRARGQVMLNASTVLIAGGFDECLGQPSAAAELLDMATGISKPTGRLQTPRYGFSMERLPSGDVLAVGGSTGGGMSGATDKIERYDIASGQWTSAGLLSMRKSGAVTCALKGGGVLVVGGSGSGGDDVARRAEVYDPAGTKVQATGSPTSYVHGSGTKTLPLDDGRCLIGSDGPGANLEIFDPAASTFTPVAVPGDIAAELTWVTQLALLPDGSALLVSRRSFVFIPKTGRFRPIP